MKRLAILLAILLFTSNKGYTQNYQEVAENIILYEDNNELLIIEPIGIHVNTDYIFIIDYGDMTIAVFKKNGEFLKKIGNRGRGPGEFVNISAVTTKDSSIYVLDAGLYKVEKFDSNLDHSQTYTSIFPFEYNTSNLLSSENNIVFIQNSWRSGLSLVTLNLNNEKFEKHELDINEYNTEADRKILNLDPGNISSKNGSNNIVYQPYIYRNIAYQIDLKNEFSISKIEYSQALNYSYEIIINGQSKPNFDIKINGRRQKISLKNISGGPTNNGKYLLSLKKQSGNWAIVSQSIDENNAKIFESGINNIRTLDQTLYMFDEYIYVLTDNGVDKIAYTSFSDM